MDIWWYLDNIWWYLELKSFKILIDALGPFRGIPWGEQCTVKRISAGKNGVTTVESTVGLWKRLTSSPVDGTEIEGMGLWFSPLVGVDLRHGWLAPWETLLESHRSGQVGSTKGWRLSGVVPTLLLASLGWRSLLLWIWLGGSQFSGKVGKSLWSSAEFQSLLETVGLRGHWLASVPQCGSWKVSQCWTTYPVLVQIVQQKLA